MLGRRSISLQGEFAVNYRLVGYRIKMAREKRKLTQETLAEIVDISTTHTSVIERGVKGMRLSTFLKIANALSVSTDELLQDQIDYVAEAHSNILYELLYDLPASEQRKLVHMIKANIEAYKRHG